VVSLNVAPQLVDSVQRVRRARKLRGGGQSGFHALRSVAIPVLEDALERSLRLAAAMDSRGYGRTGSASRRQRRTTGAFMIAGMGGLCLGAYGLLDGSALGIFAFPALIGGSLLCCFGLLLGGRQVQRSQYRPDPWTTPEWMVSACGVLPALVLLTGLGCSVDSLNPSTDPLSWPTLPLVPAVAILIGAVAAIAAPPPVRPARASAPAEPTTDHQAERRVDGVRPRPAGVPR
jgi:energy-coupling factor transport system permease protein